MAPRIEKSLARARMKRQQARKRGADVLSVIVATGRNSGARCELDEGSYRVGTDLECDVVLADPGIAGHAFTIEIQPDRTRIVVAADEVRLQTRHTVRPAVIKAGQAQSFLTPAVAHVGASCLVFTASLEELDSTRAPVKRPWLRPSLLGGGLAAMVAVFAIAAIGSTSFGSDPSPLERARESVDGLQLGNRLIVDTAPDGHVRVRGVLANEPQMRTVTRAFANVDAELKISSAGEIQTALNELSLQQVGRTYGTLLDRGNVRIEGVVVDNHARDRFAHRLSQVVPGVTGVENRLTTLDEIADAISLKLIELEVDDSVHVEHRGASLAVAGRIDEERQGRIDDLRRWFDRRYGAFYDLSISVNSTGANDPLDSLQAVVLGSDPQLILSGNRRVRPGRMIDHGWTLERIDKDLIVITRNGEVRTITF
ncbi:MAG: type III secretion system inner membrane ring subunit SctD [Geminicoccaceae bacterium]|nr:type III secretion system inner membrane ring subunit SctD [Geminicoccaceae bacterium]